MDGQPVFEDGKTVLKDYRGQELILLERQWKHFVSDRGRTRFQEKFAVIEQTLKNPTRVVESTKEKNIVLYEKCFHDYSIANTVLATAYVYVVVNWSSGIIRTVYDKPRRRTHGKVLWPKTR